MRKIAILAALIGCLFLAVVAPVADAALALQGMGAPARVTVATTWNTLTLPAGTEYIRIRPETITAYIGINCTDGGALGDHYESVTADTVEVRAVHMYDKSTGVCVAGSGSGTVQITPLARGR